jgi:membrane protein insertase Oxa1/YidC/SpoIIIJ
LLPTSAALLASSLASCTRRGVHNAAAAAAAAAPPAPPSNAALSSSSAAPSLDDLAALTADSNAVVAALQHALYTAHVSQDLPWWVSIAAFTVALRVLLLPAVLAQQRNTAKLSVRMEQTREERKKDVLTL